MLIKDLCFHPHRNTQTSSHFSSTTSIHISRTHRSVRGMNSLPSTFLQRSLADLQRTTMYQLVRKECQKPPQRIVHDNWPRLTIGILSAYNLVSSMSCIIDFFSFFRSSFIPLITFVSPATGEYPYRKASFALAAVMVGITGSIIFEASSYIALSLRPSSSHSIQRTNSDTSLLVTSVTKVEPAPVTERKPISSLWSRIHSPQVSTLRHARWMYKYSLFAAGSVPVLVSLLRYHKYWPNLWPLICNDPFWLELIAGITESLDADRLVETNWQRFDSALGPILNGIATAWALRVWIRRMEKEQEDEGEK